MKESSRTKSELLAEISILKQKNKKLEELAVNHLRVQDELQECEDNYLAVFDNSIDAILLTAPDGRILAANPEACRLFGHNEEEICKIGRDGLVDLTDPCLKALVEERKRNGQYRGELTFVHKNGTKFCGEISGSIFKDRDGNLKTSIIIRNITERKQAEEALLKRVRELNCLYSIADFIEKTDSFENLLQNIVNQIPHGLYYPEHVCARIILEDQECKTENFRETGWKLSAKLVAFGKSIGVVEICYLDKMPDRDEGPFLKEERSLINAVAERLGRVVERKRFEEERERIISELQQALSEVRTLSGLLPICASCKKIRDDKGYWNQIESYIRDHSEVEFSHGICPECMRKLYPDLCEDID